MTRLLKPFLKLPNELENIKKGIVFDKETTVNLYVQDEARFGLQTYTGSCLTARNAQQVIISNF